MARGFVKMGEALPFRELSALADVGIPADRILKEGERDPFFVSLPIASDPERSSCAVHPPRFRHEQPRPAPRFHEDRVAHGGATQPLSPPTRLVSFYANVFPPDARAWANG